MADEQIQVVRAATTCTLTPTADVDASDVVPVLADQASLQVGSVVAAVCLAHRITMRVHEPWTARCSSNLLLGFSVIPM